MSGRRSRTILEQIRDIVAAGAAPSPDQDLLQRFVRTHYEAAFAELMKRHAAMVFGVCRRVLSHSQDAEDACQATFLVLARRASAVRGSVSGWLHSVAWRTARRLKAQQSRQPARQLGSIDAAQSEATPDITWRDVRLVLDEELQRLPEKYRVPLVLCYLEGMTQDEAARRVGWPTGVLRGRLDRGRERLRTRLTQRGLALSAALFGAGLAESAVAGTVPAALEAEIVQGALQAAATSGIVSDKVAALAGEVTRTMIAKKLRNTVLMAMALLAVVSLSGTLVYRAWTSPREEEGKNTRILAAADGPNEPKPANGTDVIDGLKSLGDVIDPEDVLEIQEGQTRLGRQLLLGGNRKGTGTIHLWFDEEEKPDRDKILPLRVRVVGKTENAAKSPQRSKTFGRFVQGVEGRETIRLIAGENRLILLKEPASRIEFEMVEDRSGADRPIDGGSGIGGAGGGLGGFGGGFGGGLANGFGGLGGAPTVGFPNQPLTNRVATATLLDGRQLLLGGNEPGAARLTLAFEKDEEPQKHVLFLVEVAPRK